MTCIAYKSYKSSKGFSVNLKKKKYPKILLLQLCENIDFIKSICSLMWDYNFHLFEIQYSVRILSKNCPPRRTFCDGSSSTN